MEKKTSNQIIKVFKVIQLTPMHHHRGYSQPTIPEFLTIFPFKKEHDSCNTTTRKRFSKSHQNIKSLLYLACASS
jgi:hypothetical protein